jgi:N-carbamoylputrescine amidase
MKVKIGIVQMSCEPDVGRNLEKALAGLRDCAGRGAQIVCLPELFKSRYFCQTEDHEHFGLAEEVPGPTTELLGRRARELGVVIIASLFERRAPGLFHNTAAVLDADGSYLGKYRKMHIPDDPQFHEKFYFTPGDLGFAAWDTRHGRIGVLICWDQWYPEAARLTALQGAQIIVCPTAIGWLPAEKAQYGKDQHAAWQTVQMSHAVANGVFVAAANRVGLESTERGAIEFWGASLICDPRGRLLQVAGHEAEAALTAECDLEEVETVRTHWPFLRDRRVDAYSDLTRRFVD